MEGKKVRTHLRTHRLPLEIRRKPLTEQLEIIGMGATERTKDIYTLFNVEDETPSPPLTHLKRAGW